MSATEFFNAGFTDLVPVIPPDVKLSKNSSIKPQSRGKVPGKFGPYGWYGFSGWQTFETEIQSVKRWERWGANIGLRGDRFPGVDVDVEDETLAKVVTKFAKEHLGSTFVRLSREPRRLFVYRSTEPIPYTVLDIEYRGQTHAVEVLGKGRQYLVAGTHPSGVEYRWAKDRPPYINFDAVPLITAEGVKGFFDALTQALASKGIRATVRGGKATTEVPVQDDLLAPSLQELIDTVARIPNNDAAFPSRDDYVRMGHAIKAAAEDKFAGLVAFQEWAARWDGGTNDPEMVESDWARMHPPFRVGWQWLRERSGDTAEDDFTADPRLAPPKPQVRYSDEYFVFKILSEVKDRMKFVPDEKGGGTWMVWCEYRWVEDVLLEYERIVRKLLYSMALEIEKRGAQLKKAEGKEHRAAARRIQSANGIRAIIQMLRAQLTIQVNEFDTDPWLLNTPEGIVDLRTGERRSIVPGELFARATAVAPAVPYDSAKAPQWEKFLEYLSNGDVGMKSFLQRWTGYCLTGRVTEKMFVFAWGPSNTGKTVFIKTIGGLIEDYWRTIKITSLMTSGDGQIPDDIAQLSGVRMVTAVEPSAGMEWDDSLIKSVTGREKLNVRRMFKSWFELVPQFKLLVAGNHEPQMRTSDGTMRDRFMIVPMDHVVPKEDQRDGLEDVLIAEEGQQILAWAVQGCLDWQQNGLEPPEVVRRTTEDYWDTEDALARWIEDECELGPEHDESRRDLYASWKGWQDARGIRRNGGETVFKRQMDARAGEFKIKDARVGPHGARRRGYRGIRLTPEFEI